MADDNGPKIVIALWVMTAVSFLFMNLRFFCKGVYTKQLRIDDGVLLLAWILDLIYAALITVSVNNGMGKKTYLLDEAKVVPMYKFLFLGEFFTLIAIPVSKTSFSITLLRLSTKKWQKWFIWFVIVSVNIVYWLCGIFLLVQCQPIEKNWNKTMNGKCWQSSVQDNYSIFAGAYSALLDFVLATFPFVIIYKLQMSKKEKLGVIFAMSLGVLAGITASVKTAFLPGIGKFTDPTYSLADLLIWSNAEVAVTIIAASIPFFRVLLRAVTSSYTRSKQLRHNSYRLESYGNGTQPNGSRIGRMGVKEIPTSKGGMGERHRDLDEFSESERSILGRDGVGVIISGGGEEEEGGRGGITKRDDVVVEFSTVKRG